MTNRRLNEDTRKLVYLAILTALVVVLQVVANVTGVALPVPITLTLVPIVMSAALCGKYAGAWLGFVFGTVILLTGAAEPFFTWNPAGTIATVIIKGVLAGLAAGVVYALIENVNKYVAIMVSGIVAPIVNTGIFILGCYLFFFEDLSALAGGNNLFVYIILTMAGINFLIELGINAVLSPAILSLVNYLKKKQ